MVDAAFGELMVTCEKALWLAHNGKAALAPEKRQPGIMARPVSPTAQTTDPPFQLTPRAGCSPQPRSLCQVFVTHVSTVLMSSEAANSSFRPTRCTADVLQAVQSRACAAGGGRHDRAMELPLSQHPQPAVGRPLRRERPRREGLRTRELVQPRVPAVHRLGAGCGRSARRPRHDRDRCVLHYMVTLRVLLLSLMPPPTGLARQRSSEALTAKIACVVCPPHGPVRS